MNVDGDDLLFQAPASGGSDLVFGSSSVEQAGPSDLRFAKRHPASPDLLFGALDAGATAPDLEFQLAAAFAPLVGAARLAPVVEAQAVGVFAGLQAGATLAYRANVDRPLVRQTHGAWHIARASEGGSRSHHQDSASQRTGWSSRFDRATPRPGTLSHPLPQRLRGLALSPRGGYASAVDHRLEVGFAQQDASGVALRWQGAFAAATGLHRATAFSHQDASRRGARRRVHWELTRAVGQHHGSGFERATAGAWAHWGLFEGARPPAAGLSVRPPPPGPPLSAPCYTPDPALLFGSPWAGMPGSAATLLFVCGDGSGPPPGPAPEPVRIQIGRIVVVLNQVSITRAADGVPVPALAASLSLDADSWCWGFEATLPGVAQALVEPGADGPVSLVVSVNGASFRVLAESISRERVFGQNRLRVSGRSVHALLDAPYAPVQTFSQAELRSSQQLMDEVLSVNGVSLRWTIDYGLQPWVVPGGVFSHQGTWIDALVALAKAGGGYLLPHATERRFAVQPRYPLAPWHWDTVTPALILPEAAVARESVTWKERPAYNRVHVSGQGQGVLAQVTRAGTAGDVLAPMVTDALVTDAIAARQRGLAVLADTGRQRLLSLRLPVLPATGVLAVGAFVRYEPDAASTEPALTGIVRAVSLDIGLPEVTQTITLECHG